MSEPLAPPPSTASRAASFTNNFVAASLRQRFLTVLLALILVGFGLWSFSRLPVDAYPDLSPPMVEIITQWPGHAAEEVERLITVPIEVEMNGMPAMTALRSISLYGLSDVRMTFRHGTDNYFARQLVFERTAGLGLPDLVTPQIAPLFSPSGLIYRYVLESPDRTPMELKTIEDWIVERQYRSVPGVADDSGFGGETMQYQVLLDPAKIAAVGLSVPSVAASLAANNSNAGGGFYSQGGQFYYVRGLGRVITTEDIGNVVLAVHNGTPVLVRDVVPWNCSDGTTRAGPRSGGRSRRSERRSTSTGPWSLAGQRTWSRSPARSTAEPRHRVRRSSSAGADHTSRTSA